MPIRINLLAEAQAAEELRRKDPVKRALVVAGFLVFLVLLWCSTLQFKMIVYRSEFNGLDAQWKTIEKDYKVAVESRRKALEVEQKLGALQQLTTNRFLWGTALNAFQQTLNGVDDIQVARLKAEQIYTLNEEVKARTNNTQMIPGKPGSAVEKITMTIEAMDASAQPGSQVNKFKEAIAGIPYYQTTLQKTNGVLLTTMSPPQVPQGGRTPHVLFTLQCYFQEKLRY